METFPEKIRIRAYALHWTRPALPPEARPVAYRFASGWMLAGFHHAGEGVIAPRRWGVFPPTRQLHLTLYWHRLPEAGGNVRFQATLVHSNGTVRVEGAPPPGSVLERYPPSSWPFDMVVVDIGISSCPPIRLWGVIA